MMKRFFIWNYPRLTLYVLSTIIAYLLFRGSSFSNYFGSSGFMVYISIFLGGLLFSTGFTTPIATGFFLSLDVSNVLLFSCIAGFGALISDFGIFSFIRFSFMDEFRLLQHSSLLRHLSLGINKVLNKKTKKLLTLFIAFLVIASPLPDEIGVALLAGFTKVHPRIFAIISFTANTFGIFLLLLI